jgi:hypothetical protein
LKAGSEEAVKFSVDLDELYTSNSALSCDKRRLILCSNTIVDLEQQCTLARVDLGTRLPSYSTAVVGSSPFSPDIFLSFTDKLRVVDIRLASNGGLLKPVQTVDLPSRSWYLSSATFHMRDDYSVWMGSDHLVRADLRLGLALKYNPFGRSTSSHARNVLVDPVECRAVEFAQCDGLAPLICCYDLSGEEWTHTIHSGMEGTSAVYSSLNSTQFICFPQCSTGISSLYVYDL